METFYQKSSPEVKKAAFTFVGRSLFLTKEKLEDSVTSLLEDFLETRVKAADLDELKSFSFWFNSIHFTDAWKIKWLKTILSMNVHLNPDLDLMQKLSEMKKTFPLEVIECLKLLIKHEDGFRLHSNKDLIRDILKYYIDNDPSLQPNVLSIADTMGSKGFLEFRELVHL